MLPQSYRRRDNAPRPGIAPAALLALSLLFAQGSAFAQGDKAAAETLFQAGIALMNEGKFAEACPKFAESQRADPSSGTLLNLGSCYERIGKTASAWATYKEAAALAHSLGQTDREATANGRIAALEPVLSKLRIDAGDVPGLVIKRDGFEVGRASLGVPIAVDPGDHVLVASAPGYEDWTATVTVGANGDVKSIPVPPLQKKAEAAVVPAPTLSGQGSPPDWRRTAGFIIGGVGVAAIGVGAVFGGLAISDKSDAEALCPNTECDEAGYNLIDSASTKALVSTIGIGVGLAAVGAGITLVILSSSSNEGAGAAPPTSDAPSEARRRPGSSITAKLIPSIGPSSGGVTLIGRF